MMSHIGPSIIMSLPFLLFILVSFIPVYAISNQIPLIHNDTGRTCNPGFFENGNTCQPCPVGTFRSVDINPFICIPCAPGTAAASLGSSVCNPCPSARFQPKSGGSVCQSCPSNTIPNAPSAATSCTPCPPRNFTPRSLPGSCITCSPGQFFNLNSRACTPCPAGFISTQNGALNCTACPPGTVAETLAGPCNPCLPGTFSTEPTNLCKPCPTNFYQPKSGSRSCIKCPLKSFTNATGASTCIPNNPSLRCPSGQSRNAGTGLCQPCRPGSVSTGNIATSCTECAAPEIPNADATACVCPREYTIQDASRRMRGNLCLRCPRHGFSLDGNICQCPPGLYYDSGRLLCVCQPRQTFNGEKCVPCASGAQAGEDESCDFCAKGFGFNSESNRCERCPEQFTVTGRPTFDMACEKFGCPGDKFFSFNERRCFCSEKNSVFETLEGPCRRCPLGQVNRRVSTRLNLFNVCFDCAVNDLFPMIFNGVDCIPCARSLESINNECVPRCREDQLRDGSTGECLCKTDPQLPNGECGSCAPNLIYSFSERRCSCRSGTMLDLQTRTCQSCPGGTLANRGVCEACPALSFRPDRRQFFCGNCPQADPDAIGASECIAAKCMSNEFVGSDGQCQTCLRGERLRNRSCVSCMNAVSPGGRRAFCSKGKPHLAPNADGGPCVRQKNKHMSRRNCKGGECE